jgi:hypothetical protein
MQQQNHVPEEWSPQLIISSGTPLQVEELKVEIAANVESITTKTLNAIK